MKRNNKRKQKRLEEKRRKRKTREKKKHPIVEWLTDTMFVIHCNDCGYTSIFSSITIEEIDDDFEWHEIEDQFDFREMDTDLSTKPGESQEVLPIHAPSKEV
jgi:predicted nucleic-acid-binding Zn-ribbon protein